MSVRMISWLLVLQLLVAANRQVVAAEPGAKELEQSYGGDIRPLIARYCQKCHSGDRTEADVDLGVVATWNDVRKHPETWQKVGQMLDSAQMPPKDEPQPTVAERKKLDDWVRGYLTMEAKSRAGDPGRVVLRRLSNAEYTYTLRDLTGVGALDPAKEFPVDGAAGEGFTNTGNALVMSPALVTKYLDAAKGIANHAVLLPDGFAFSPNTTRRDWTNDKLAEIRSFYRQFTDAGGGDKVNLQGIVFDTNEGGRLPLDKYLLATLAERERLAKDARNVELVARERNLNAKYLGTLWNSLASKEPSLLLTPLRARWQSAKAEDAPALAAEIAAWQKSVFKFGSVGHVGKVGGPKRWLETVSPLVSQQDVRFKFPPTIPSGEITVTLVTSDAGDGNEHDFALWQNPRIVAPGWPDLPLRNVRHVMHELISRRDRILGATATYLAAADEAAAAQGKSSPDELAKKHGLETDVLAAWLNYLGIGSGGNVELTGHFTTKLTSGGGYEFVQGWGSDATPQLVANSSDKHVRIPGNMKPHGVAVHPSPTLRAAAGWKSPVTAKLRVEGAVTHAHPECGNGVTWLLELRRGSTRQRLATGTAQGNKEFKIGPLENVAAQAGDVISLLIGPRDGNHSCDLTAIDLKLATFEEQEADRKTWDLAADVSGDILAGNPHADRYGNQVWHFYTESEGPTATSPVIPAGSLLSKWQEAKGVDARKAAADEVQKLLTGKTPEGSDAANAALFLQLRASGGPLLGGILRSLSGGKFDPMAQPSKKNTAPSSEWGLDPALFGKHPSGGQIAAANLCVQAPSTIEVRLPADLVEGCELVTSGALEPKSGAEGSIQLQVLSGKAPQGSGLKPSEVTVTQAGGQWTGDNRRTSFAAPILVNEGSQTRKRIEAAFEEFRQLFPAALCYTKIVPVDEVVTLTLFYREDDHLMRLMLSDAEQQRLDKLWDELHYISQDAVTLVDALEQLIQYATQDADPKVFEPLRKPFADRAAAYRQRLIDTEPRHLDSLLAFAAQAYRRPFAEAEAKELRGLYARLREQEIPHEDAFRLTLSRVLVSPAFLYRIEKPAPGAGQGPASDFELASRLSYFLWSSQPDEELRQLAAAGRLSDPEVLRAQARRMLKDAKTRRLATEFACQWLHIHDFEHLDEKSERHFPTFAGLRGAMHEESIQFFTDLFQNDGSVTGILDADYTFLNEDLAQHYGIAGVQGTDWRRVEGVKKSGRGGILAHATTLATQSGASRTSPILRGNWISEVLLGERLPRPPKGVPVLPDDESATAGLTVRQLVEKHTLDEKCSICHKRIDPFGFSLESYDAIGRLREKDLGDRPIDTRVKALDGTEFTGLDGLRKYLLTTRRDAFVRQFCKKLLGYSLGRSVQLSDEPLLAEMQSELKAKNYSVLAAVDLIIQSRQFREIRGRETAYND
jgi:Protein of unknown function (DUF1592)/Protein of unknown function (DUF1588)/Protein of unknown function (DUF1587)/Protein of unknown function (DUF1585)/Protein of unknown function (DUF1595)